MLLCKFCGKECKSSNSLRNHERLCKHNPNRNIEHIYAGQEKRTAALRTRKIRGTFSNQWTDPKYKLKDSTRQKLSAANKERNWDKIWSEEKRKQHSNTMKLAVEKYPESYTSSNRGRTKQVIIDGIKFQGAWEVEFYQYCKKNLIKIERSTEWFEYEWNGKRKYFPDFYLPDRDLYVEVKGYETDRDRAKWSVFPKKLRVIKKEDIIAIRNQCFQGL